MYFNSMRQINDLLNAELKSEQKLTPSTVALDLDQEIIIDSLPLRGKRPVNVETVIFLMPTYYGTGQNDQSRWKNVNFVLPKYSKTA